MALEEINHNLNKRVAELGDSLNAVKEARFAEASRAADERGRAEQAEAKLVAAEKTITELKAKLYDLMVENK